tara:strand:+ start:631 stop:897 length:267 start_codon:yes stop_codon:yes gene_type:complete
MAEQYDNTNRFALFKNNKTKDSQPDYTGTITLEGGKEMSLSAWVRESKKGDTYMSGQMQEPYVPDNSNAPKETVAPKSFDEIASDVPF